MDHTIQAYMKRLPTEKLENALDFYIQSDRINDHCYEILLILDEIRQRFVPTELTPGDLQALEEYKRRIKESSFPK